MEHLMTFRDNLEYDAAATMARRLEEAGIRSTIKESVAAGKFALKIDPALRGFALEAVGTH